MRPKPVVIPRINSCDSRIPMEESIGDFPEERCCFCPGSLDSFQLLNPTEKFCNACKRLHSLPVELEKECKFLDHRSRRRNLYGVKTDVKGEKGHRCRSSVNEARCLRCASSVVRWNSARRTVQRLVWLIVPLLLLTLVSPSIAKLHKSISGRTKGTKGE